MSDHAGRLPEPSLPHPTDTDVEPLGQGAPDKSRAIHAAWMAIAVYVIFNLLLPLIPIRLHGLNPVTVGLLVLLPTMLFMLLQLWLSRALVGLRPRPLVCALAMIISVGAWSVILQSVHPHHGMPIALLKNFGLGFCVTLACTFFGILLSRIIREANVLLPVALVAMPIDYIGAMTPVGFTKNAVQQHPGIVQAVSVPVPVIGGLHPIGYIGPGDALFMAFFFAVVLRLGLNMRGTFRWMYGLLTATMLIVLTTGLDIAALIPMGLAMLIANGRSFRLQRSEVFATVYAGLLVLGLIVAFYFYSHTHFFHP